MDEEPIAPMSICFRRSVQLPPETATTAGAELAADDTLDAALELELDD